MARNKYDVDETLEQRFDFKKLKRALVYVKPYTKLMILALSLTVIASVLNLIPPIFLQKAMDVAIPEKNIDFLVKLGLASAGVIIAASIFDAIRGLVMANIGQSMIYNLRMDVFKHLQKLSFNYYDSRPHGKILIRVVDYVNSVADTLTNGMINAVIDLLNVVFIAFFMFYLDAKLALYVLIGIPPLMVFLFFLKNHQKKLNFICNNKRSNLVAYNCESIQGVKVTEIFNRQDESMSIYSKLNNTYKKVWLHWVYFTNTLHPITDTLKQWIICIVYIAGVMWLSPTVEVGVIIAMATYASKFWMPIINMANVYNNLLRTASYLERIFETLDEPVEITDAENSVNLDTIKGDIEFKNVNFEYDTGHPVLKNVSFKIEAGQSVALVGETGSGKSTIVSLMSRFYNVAPDSVFIDGIDINTIAIKSLRTNMGVMLQDSFIFSGTIADNIRYGKLDATIEEIKQAARTVCADKFIEKLPDGYETVVSENGGSLSQGEKQLIAFARTVLSDPKILILDEATSTIDTRTEKLLQEGIKNLLKGRTSVIIAHRLSTIKNCDLIMHIEDGIITESGTHDELMNKKGQYYDLCQLLT